MNTELITMTVPVEWMPRLEREARREGLRDRLVALLEEIEHEGFVVRLDNVCDKEEAMFGDAILLTPDWIEPAEDW